jgi:hypothetical protein
MPDFPNVIETREVFRDGTLSLVAQVVEDPESDPTETDLDTEYAAAWDRGEWRYVGVVVAVVVDEVEVAYESLWGVESGDVCGTDADPLADYPLNDVALEAIDRAATWFAGVNVSPGPLERARELFRSRVK